MADNGSDGNGSPQAPGPAEGSPEWVAEAHRAAQEFASRERIPQRGPDGRAVVRPGDVVRLMTPEEEAAALRQLPIRGMNAKPLTIPDGWAAASAGGGCRPKASGYDLVLQVTGGVNVLPAVLDALKAREEEALAAVAEVIHGSAEAERLAQSRQRLEELRQGEAAAKTQLSEAEAALADAAAGAVPKLARKKAAASEVLGGFGGPRADAERTVAEQAAALTASANATLSRARMALTSEAHAALPAHNKSVSVPPDVSAHEWLLGLAKACELGRRTAAQTWGGYFVRQALERHLPPAPAQATGALLTQAEWMLKHQPESVEQAQPAPL
jgi:hypothetical protein